jgi:putative hydrolase of the HAD superfamily
MYQSDDDNRDLAAILKMDPETFKVAYWAQRSPYDAGDASDLAYWEGVSGRPLDEAIVARLVAADAESWCKPNTPCLAFFQRLAARQNLALLSNAPVSLARAIVALEWLPPMERRFFSCDLRLAKPDPRIYRAVATELDVAMSNITLIDDRLENVQGALAAGLKARRFTDVENIVVALCADGGDTGSHSPPSA